MGSPGTYNGIAQEGVMFGKQAVSDETICNRIREEIIPILYQVVRNDEIMFHNPHIVRCWERKGCDKSDCVAHGNTESPAGTAPEPIAAEPSKTNSSISGVGADNAMSSMRPVRLCVRK